MRMKLFDELLSKEMTRKEFLFHISLLLFVLTGISGLLKTLSDPHLTKKNKRSSHALLKKGFGKGSYGV